MRPKVERVMILVIDIGNSYTKIALYEGKNVIRRELAHRTQHFDLKDILNKSRIERIAISTVGRECDIERQAEASGIEIIRLERDMKLPFVNDYLTPETLGLDRIAGMLGAWGTHEGAKNFLVMDLGTCNTYDMMIDGHYIGGNIAPGVEMRLKAMHEFTAKLPLISVEEADEAVERMSGKTGRTTREAMACGAIVGMTDEIEKVISDFRQLTGSNGICVMTGGYADVIAKRLRNNVEVNPYLVLDGLCFFASWNKQRQLRIEN